jgi:hypothetical protein
MYFKIVHNISFCFGLSLLNGSSYVHTFCNVKLNDHTLCLYNVQIELENKQYGINFEIAIFSQIKLQLQNFPYAFFS